MKVTLSRRQRALLLFLSASGYTAWFSGLGDRTSAEELGAVPQPFVTIDVRPDLPRVASLIVRDPFAGKPSAAAQTPPDGAQAVGAASAQREFAVASVPGRSDTVVVPDIANAGVAPAPAAALTLVLRATIVGPSPVAYVANGTAMDIVRVGDTLGERRVTKIDLRGIAFDDGTRLDLPLTYLATPRPAPRRSAGGERLTLETLRRLLLPARDQQENAARASQTQAPQLTPATSTSAFPTPGPLSTVNTQGLPVGVNPTSDPNGPTPYPNPYPYAPPAHH